MNFLLKTPDRVAFTVFGIDIMWYGLLIGIGMIVAVALAYLRAPKHGLNSDRVLDVVLYSIPAGVIGDTAANLRAAAGGEHEEWSEAYPAFADKADEEGFPEIATMYRMISVAEKYHEERFRRLLERVEGGTMFKNGTPIAWRCRNCGFVTEAPEAPEKCPACAHPRDYFERLAENF